MLGELASDQLLTNGVTDRPEPGAPGCDTPGEAVTPLVDHRPDATAGARGHLRGRVG